MIRLDGIESYLISLFEHDLRANALRVCREGKSVSTHRSWPEACFSGSCFDVHDVPRPAVASQLAVSAAIFRDGKILLVRRARSPAKGFYSLPGGRSNSANPAHRPAREVDEETALRIEIIGLADGANAAGNRQRRTLSDHVIAARWTSASRS